MKGLPFKARSWTSEEQWRIKTFWDKEPETLLWIESFGARVSNDWFGACNQKIMFMDIGANIGLYSLYAATLYPELRIIAVEPLLENFQSLIANIKENCFENIVPVYAGVSDKTGIYDFKSLTRMAGSSNGQINKEDTDLLSRKIMAYDMDLFCFTMGCPTFLKMDIDGGEYDAFKTMEDLFKNPILNSMLIEFEKNSLMNNAVNNILSHGLTMQNEFNLLLNPCRVLKI